MNTKAPKIDDVFYLALYAEDELGVVIRAQIHIESSVNDFIEKKISNLKTIRQLRFSQRVELACELGLGADIKQPLKKLGDLRNDFAHKLDTKLSTQKVESFYHSFDTEAQKFFQKAYEESGSVMLLQTPQFVNLSPKDKFAIMAVALKARVALDVNRI